MDAMQQLLTKQIQLRQRVMGGASWFFFIAGLSIVTAVIITTGGNWHFLVGLATTEVVARLASQLGPAGKVVAFALNAFIAGIFILFGIFARKRMGWAFIVGMLLYALDGLIFVADQVWASAAFHVIALFFIFSGFKALSALAQAEREIADAQAPPVPQSAPAPTIPLVP